MIENFPEEEQKNFLLNKIKDGAVVKIDLKGKHKVNKRKILIMIDPQSPDIVGFVFINSKINYNVHKDRLALEQQIKLKSNEDRPFIIKDSYVDTTDVQIESFNDFFNWFISDSDRKIWEINKSDLSLVKRFIKSSKTISKAKKKLLNL